MDSKEESLCTDGNSSLAIMFVCKALTFLMAKKRIYTNNENSALLSFSVDVKF